MTDQQIEDWKKERDIARAIVDPASREVALEKVYDHRDEMQMRCICHQAQRQKEMAIAIAASKRDIDDLKSEIIPLKALNRRAGQWRERVKGAAFLWRLLAVLGAAGFGAVILRLFNITNQVVK